MLQACFLKYPGTLSSWFIFDVWVSISTLDSAVLSWVGFLQGTRVPAPVSSRCFCQEKRVLHKESTTSVGIEQLQDGHLEHFKVGPKKNQL